MEFKGIQFQYMKLDQVGLNLPSPKFAAVDIYFSRSLYQHRIVNIFINVIGYLDFRLSIEIQTY